MNILRDYKKNISLIILISAGAMGVVLFLAGFSAFARGFVLGSIFSFANFQIMTMGLTGRLAVSGRKASIKSTATLLLRLVILGVPIYFAGNQPERFNLIATIIGIFNLQLSILAHAAITSRFSLSGSINAGNTDREIVNGDKG